MPHCNPWERANALMRCSVTGSPRSLNRLHLVLELVPDLLEGGLARPVECLVEDGMHDLVSGYRREGSYEHEERREPDAHAQTGPELAPRLRGEQLTGLSPEV